MPLRLAFMGTPDFAVPTLAEILGQGHEVAAVYSQPPRPAGRGMAEAKSPVHIFAESAGLTVRTPRSLKGEAEQSEFAALDLDAAVVVAYGLILPPAILRAPKHGCLNLHGSALPRWRGAAPIQRAIMAGDSETAVMVMRMDEGLDTGPICLGERIAIPPAMTAGELHDIMAAAGASLMARALSALERGSLECRPQPSEGVTYAAKISKQEARIDFNRPAEAVVNHIRGLSPFPGAFFELSQGGKRERIKVLAASRSEGSGEPGRTLDDALAVACASGAIRVTWLQRAGRQAMSAEEALRGLKVPAGVLLG